MAITTKIVLEIVIVLVSLILSYTTYKVFSHLKADNSRFRDAFKIIFWGFFLFFLSMLFELIDSFYLDTLFDSLQLITGILSIIVLLIGFRDGSKVASKSLKVGKKNA